MYHRISKRNRGPNKPYCLWRPPGLFSKYSSKTPTSAQRSVLDGLDECDDDTLRKLVPKIVDLFSPEYVQSTSKAFRLVILCRDIPGLYGRARVQLDPANDDRVATKTIIKIAVE